MTRARGASLSSVALRGSVIPPFFTWMNKVPTEVAAIATTAMPARQGGRCLIAPSSLSFRPRGQSRSPYFPSNPLHCAAQASQYIKTWSGMINLQDFFLPTSQILLPLLDQREDQETLTLSWSSESIAGSNVSSNVSHLQ